MNETNLFNSYIQLLQAIEHCVQENLLLPALVLIYTAIDSASWVATESETETVGSRFQQWAENWMQSKYPLPCTAEELYAARCGILHTLTPHSRLSSQKDVKRLAYAWGKASREDLEESFKILDNNEFVALHIQELFNSFRLGFADFVETTMSDEKKAIMLSQKADMHFANLDISSMNEFLKSARDLGAQPHINPDSATPKGERRDFS